MQILHTTKNVGTFNSEECPFCRTIIYPLAVANILLLSTSMDCK